MAEQRRGRRRPRLVPPDGVECFEIRAALWFEADGSALIGYSISSPDGQEVQPPLHEVLGVLRFTEASLLEAYAAAAGE